MTIQCAYCGQIKDKNGKYDGIKWEIIRKGEVSHGICPECYKIEVEKIENDLPQRM
jgi:hypothetical protein